jgi:phage replication-related protein YjqB (UPF0714/DUF867 family)
MDTPDRYRSYADLAAHEQAGVDFAIRTVTRSRRLAVVAPHGGGIEPGTSELATALAGDLFSLYLFEGQKTRGSRGLHITSTRFDEPRCLALLADTETVVTVHGCEGELPFVYTGGLHLGLQAVVIQRLQSAGFAAGPDNPARAGEHPNNLCNRGRSGRGLQLEISEGLRRQLFVGLDRRGRRDRTPRFDPLVQALQTALLCSLTAAPPTS